VLVPLLGVAWLIGSHNVTLQVDGQAQTLTTYARTVDELLDRSGVKYGEHDEVVPAPDTALRDGMVVELVRAREITLLIGDQQKTVFVTALSMDDVIDQLARRSDVSRRAIVRPSRMAPIHSGMTVSLLTPVGVTVVVDGQERSVVTDARTVAGVLERLDIELGASDRVTPSVATEVTADLRITVERVRVERQHDTVAIPFETETRYTDELTEGEERELQAGVDGSAEVTDRVTYIDGVEVARYTLDRDVLTAPTTRIVEIGTAAPEQPSSSAPAPTQPAPTDTDTESEYSEPAAEEASGSTQTGEASYYYHPEEGMTAAHRTLPFGTVVTVTNLATGQSVNVTINDRGPYIAGRIIDLNEQAFEAIASKSSGVIDVRITW
jgi:uncharacterized protein YabE (DUF348 family)